MGKYFPYKASEPYTLLRSMHCGDVFRFCGGQGDELLLLRAPGYHSPVYEESIPQDGLAMRLRGSVCVSVTYKIVPLLPVSQRAVLRTSQIAEYPLHTLP